MKYISYIFILSEIILGTSCNRQVSQDYDWTDKKVNLSGHPMKIDTALIGAYNYCVFPDCIVVQLSHGTRLLHYYAIRNDSLCWQGQMLYRGSGPYELQYPMCLQIESQGTPILKIAGAYSENRTFDIRMDDPHFFFDIRQWKKGALFSHELGFETLGILDSISFLTVTTAAQSEDMIASFSFKDSVMTGTGYHYPPDNVNAAPIVKALVYAGNITRRPGGDQFLYSCSTGKYAFIFRLDDHCQIKDIHYLYDIYPKYIVAKDGLNYRYTQDCEEGFVQTVTADYIYLGDRSRTIADRNPNYPNGFFDEVLKFDWDGNPCTKYVLNCPAAKVVVSSNDKILYGFTIHPKTGLESFIKYTIN